MPWTVGISVTNKPAGNIQAKLKAETAMPHQKAFRIRVGGWNHHDKENYDLIIDYDISGMVENSFLGVPSSPFIELEERYSDQKAVSDFLLTPKLISEIEKISKTTRDIVVETSLQGYSTPYIALSVMNAFRFRDCAVTLNVRPDNKIVTYSSTSQKFPLILLHGLNEELPIRNISGRLEIDTGKKCDTWSVETVNEPHELLKILSETLIQLENHVSKSHDLLGNMLKAQTISAIECFLKEINSPVIDKISVARKAGMLNNLSARVSSTLDPTQSRVGSVEKIVSSIDKIVQIVSKWMEGMF